VRAPLIAWLSDFGTSDHYVGVMKGVALTIAPDLTFVDITHDIAPQDVLAGAMALGVAYRFFPPETIFVAVVDPGVGSSRKAVAARIGSRTFVGPDNGLFTRVLDEGEPVHAVELATPRFALPEISRTFEGRDRFAPAAAWLARGVQLDDLGPKVPTLRRLQWPTPRQAGSLLEGEVIHVDRFGNAISNLTALQVDAWRQGEAVRVLVGDLSLDGLAGTYVDVEPGAPCALVGSAGYLEVAVNGGNAAVSLGIGRGTPILLRKATAL
jgi:hypothetical protein